MSEKLRLYCNTGKEDKMAIDLLMKARIPFINLGPTLEQPTPFLEYGYWKFSGIRVVLEFIERWKNEKLPPLDLFK